MPYAVNLGDVLNQLVVEAGTPFEAVVKAQHLTGRLDQEQPGRRAFTVTVDAKLVPECRTWGDPCERACDCEQVLYGEDVRVTVMLDRSDDGRIVVSPDRPDPVLDPASVIGRRWVIDVPVPRPHKRYLHVVGGPVNLQGMRSYWLSGSTDSGGSFIPESTLIRAMAKGVEVPPGTDPLDYTCSECGEVTHPSYVGNNQIGAALRARGLCFIDDFWARAYADYQAGKRVVVDGSSYTIGPARDAGPKSCRGHGGRLFRIQYPDGRVVETTNLWSQGTIPARWRDRMADSAVFVPDEPPAGFHYVYEGHTRRLVRDKGLEPVVLADVDGAF